MANGFIRLLLLAKPPLSSKNVSSTDKTLNDNSFSFCGTELFNISFLSPAHFRAAHTGRKGLPRELCKRLVPGTSVGPAVPLPTQTPWAHVINISMLPSAGRWHHWQRLGNETRLPRCWLNGDTETRGRGDRAGQCVVVRKGHNRNSPTLRASGPQWTDAQLLLPQRNLFYPFSDCHRTKGGEAIVAEVFPP